MWYILIGLIDMGLVSFLYFKYWKVWYKKEKEKSMEWGYNLCKEQILKAAEEYGKLKK